MQWTSKRRLAGIVAVLAAAAGGGAGLAAAQAGDAAEPRGPEAVLAGVAERLGISEAELREAFEAEALERLDAAVAAGRLTEEQAARIRERIEAGRPPLHRHPGHRPIARMIETAAEYVGVDPADLLAELRTGKSLAEVAEAHGKTAAGLEQALLEEAKQAIHELVNRELPPLPPLPPEPGAS